MTKDWLNYAVFVALAGSAACGDPESPFDTFAPQTCTQDTDCSSGHACNFAAGHCAPMLAKVLGLVVLPPTNTSGWVRDEFVEPTAGDDGQFVINLAPGAQLSGRVHPSDAPDTQLAAQVIATRTSKLEGFGPIRFETTSTETAHTDNGSNYQIWLNRGYDYDLQVLPNSPVDKTVPCATQPCSIGYPTAVWPRVRVDASAQRDLTLAAGNDAVTLHGTLTDAAGQPFDHSVQVRAIADDGTQSSVGFTCSVLQREYCDCDSADCHGTYTIQVPATPKTYTLRIDPIRTDISESDDAPRNVLIPSMECSGLRLGQPSIDSIPLVRLPAFARAAQFQVRITGNEEESPPVSGAQVTFTYSNLSFTRLPDGFSNCEAIYQRSAVTDAEGRAELALLPGTETNSLYRVTISTPPRSVYANQVLEDYEVGPQAGVLAPFRLRQRAYATGVVLDHLDRPISRASIEAQEVPANADAPPLVRPLGRSEGETSQDGSFSLAIEPGVYNFRIRPPATSGIPSFLSNARPIGLTSGPLRFSSPEPGVMLGQVVVAGDRADDPFVVQAYDLAPKTAEARYFRSVLQETAFTDARGHFRMVLPLR